MASPSYSRQQGTARTYKITATAAALIIGVLVSLGAVYGLNRYLGPSVDPAETTGALHHRTPND